MVGRDHEQERRAGWPDGLDGLPLEQRRRSAGFDDDAFVEESRETELALSRGDLFAHLAPQPPPAAGDEHEEDKERERQQQRRDLAFA